jgi:chromosome condensin MukBEF ATPase and DNA-binding subunit MukB
MKKKLESDVLDLETALEHANAANAETQVNKPNTIDTFQYRYTFCYGLPCVTIMIFQKSIKKYQQSLREAQARLEEEARAKEIAHDMLINNDRRAHANQVGHCAAL